MRTVVDGRLGVRLLVPGALLLIALGAPAVGGTSADGAANDTVAGSSIPDLTVVRPGTPLPLPTTTICGDQNGVPELWDNLFPTCNRDDDPVTAGAGVN
ncbi:hypothetical protein [Micromonospora sp. WMMD737]|uniref:hypothetical protein n=1 Tax=Micromonospora sp. WMMD737 TaxID=3404113 RepID=UPI003B95C06A